MLGPLDENDPDMGDEGDEDQEEGDVEEDEELAAVLAKAVHL